MLSYYQRTVTSRKGKVFDTFRVGSWVRATAPTVEERLLLVEERAIDEGLLSDALDPYEVPRVESADGAAYFFTRMPVEEKGTISMVPLTLVVAKDCFLTIASREFPFFETFAGREQVYTTQKVQLLLRLLFAIGSEYERVIVKVNREVRRITANISTEISNADIIAFITLETVLHDLHDALVPMQTALQNLRSGKLLKLYEEDREYAEDVALANGQLIDLCRANIRTIQNVRESYTTIMSNNMNHVIKFLTGMTIIVTVPSIIINLYGMNVRLPLQDSPYAFSLILASVVLVTGGSLWFFIRRKWL